MNTYSSEVSSVGPPLSLSKGERQPDQESATATAADITNMNLSVDEHQRRSMTSIIDNAPALNNRGIDQYKAVTTAGSPSSWKKIAHSNEADKWAGLHVTPGRKDDRSAFSSEIRGVYAMTVVIELICNFFHISNRSVSFGSDCEAALYYIFDRSKKQQQQQIILI
jgi:hypothetical protein